MSMSIHRAITFLNKIDQLIYEATKKFDINNYKEKVVVLGKSDINTYIENEKYTDITVVEHNDNYGKYTAIQLTKVLRLLWEERTMLHTGIILAKNTLKIPGNDPNNTFSYDAINGYNESRRNFMYNLDKQLNDESVIDRTESIEKIDYNLGTYGTFSVDKSITVTYKNEEIDRARNCIKDLLSDLEDVDSMLEEALCLNAISDKYIPIIPYESSFDDLYKNIDDIIAFKQNKSKQVEENSGNENNVTVTADDVEANKN